MKCKIIGLGSNLLFSDKGFRGVVIVNKTSKTLFRGNTLYSDSGCSIGSLIQKCILRSLSGFETFAGIPSTVGGAITNNMGAFGREISDIVEWVECYHKSDLTKKLRLTKNECNFSYRDSIFKSNDYIITRIKFNLTYLDRSKIQATFRECLERKKTTQPTTLPSAGSVFKRSQIIPAKIIDEIGLKGLNQGDAQVSTKHAGFIVNTGNATSEDVLILIQRIKEIVFNKTGHILTEEIEFVNE